MSLNDMQLVWLRRGLTAFVGLLALTVTCGLIWALLAALGDSIGAKAFRIVTLVTAIADGICGIALFIGSVRSLIQIRGQFERITGGPSVVPRDTSSRDSLKTSGIQR